MEDKDLYDYFLGGKVEDDDQAATDQINPETSFFYQQLQDNPFRTDDEGALTIHLENEGLEIENEMVVIAQIDGKDHHVEPPSSVRPTIFNGKENDQGTTNNTGHSYNNLSTHNGGVNQIVKSFAYRTSSLNLHGESQAEKDSLKSGLQSNESILEISIVDPMAGSTREIFICQYCDKLFPDEITLKVHEAGHSGLSVVMVKSEKNDEGFNILELKSNGKAHVFLECDICYKKFEHTESLVVHKKSHENGMFKCTECVRSFFRRADLEQHKKIHTVEHKNLGNVTCDVCHKIFKHADALALHKNIHIAGALFKCSECIRIFFNQADLEVHKKSHLNRRRFVYERSPPTTSKDDDHKCHYCDKTFDKIPHLENHERIHNGLRPFRCQFCAKGFTQKTHVVRHEMIHLGEKPYQCHFCYMRFGQNSQRQSHERTHTGERPYECKFCLRTFTQIGNLHKHEEVHEMSGGPNDYQYSCSYCDKSYKHKKNVVAHEHVHTGERPYKCKICDKDFVRKDALRSHERLHPELGEVTKKIKRIKCEICSQKFANEYTFEIHQMSHRVKELFMCPICDMEFETGTEAVAHEKVHADQGPFYCPSCSKPFITKVEIEEHMKKVHVKQEAE